MVSYLKDCFTSYAFYFIIIDIISIISLLVTLSQEFLIHRDIILLIKASLRQNNNINKKYQNHISGTMCDKSGMIF
jgi:hypothetical protein